MGTSINRLNVLKNIAELLNEATDIHTILQEVLKKLLTLTGLSTGWIFLIEKNGKHKLAAYENLPPALEYNELSPMCKGGCWCVNKFNNGTLHKASNIIECQRIEIAIMQKLGDTGGITHHATIPLHVGNERFGLINVASPNKTFFTEEELALLEATAHQIGAAIKRIQLTKKEQEMALREERNRLARDLHDSVNQLLFSMTLTARGGKEMTADQEVKETFQYIQELAQQALSEMRALIWQLKPIGLEDGLLKAIKSYGEMLNLNVHDQIIGVGNLPSNVEEVLWRVSQEAFNNCKKHAGTNDIWVTIEHLKNEVILSVKDEGSGFTIHENNMIPTLGLSNMKTRVESVGGTFSLTSQPNQGTSIQIKISF
ncbi:two-component system NarL family sensor kinase [Bacillus oleivorans]|uniref:histidine kinase n=1 Tax=Bacillus oleivorans TaxID=1448271 RepID=A0A285CR97_9BACI|nr:GAF domain-containing sensor histidine kinase [Bacillus oleivorans]SNX69945.1 two-component system NarL family sensor kinase [Bacillus oleivorans]